LGPPRAAARGAEAAIIQAVGNFGEGFRSLRPQRLHYRFERIRPLSGTRRSNRRTGGGTFEGMLADGRIASAQREAPCTARGQGLPGTLASQPRFFLRDQGKNANGEGGGGREIDRHELHTRPLKTEQKMRVSGEAAQLADHQDSVLGAADSDRALQARANNASPRSHLGDLLDQEPVIVQMLEDRLALSFKAKAADPLPIGGNTVERDGSTLRSRICLYVH